MSPDVKLARLLRGYRNGLAEKLSQGPAGYSGAFPVRKSCGQLLVNLAADVERYFGDVAHLVEGLGDLATRSRGAATEREFTFGEGVVGYNDFTEGALQDVCDQADRILTDLPQAPTALGCQ